MKRPPVWGPLAEGSSTDDSTTDNSAADTFRRDARNRRAAIRGPSSAARRVDASMCSTAVLTCMICFWPLPPPSRATTRSTLSRSRLAASRQSAGVVGPAARMHDQRGGTRFLLHHTDQAPPGIVAGNPGEQVPHLHGEQVGGLTRHAFRIDTRLHRHRERVGGRLGHVAVTDMEALLAAPHLSHPTGFQGRRQAGQHVGIGDGLDLRVVEDGRDQLVQVRGGP